MRAIKLGMLIKMPLIVLNRLLKFNNSSESCIRFSYYSSDYASGLYHCLPLRPASFKKKKKGVAEPSKLLDVKYIYLIAYSGIFFYYAIFFRNGKILLLTVKIIMKIQKSLYFYFISFFFLLCSV